ENDAALQLRGRVVQVHDGPPGAADRVERLLDQLRARLGEDLDRDVVGDQPLFDDLANKGPVGVGRRRKADLDLLEAELQQHLEHAALALGPHRLDQRLVAVAQIDAAPGRRLVEDARRPRAVGQVYRRERAVFVDRHGGHRKTPRRTGRYDGGGPAG